MTQSDANDSVRQDFDQHLAGQIRAALQEHLGRCPRSGCIDQASRSVREFEAGLPAVVAAQLVGPALQGLGQALHGPAHVLVELSGCRGSWRPLFHRRRPPPEHVLPPDS
jgi:hypothetical protein